MKNKIISIFFLLFFIVGFRLMLLATDEIFDTDAILVQAITITEVDQMDFGTIEVDGTAGTAVLTTGDAISGGTGGYSASAGSPTSAEFSITSGLVSLTFSVGTTTLAGSGSAAGGTLDLGTFTFSPTSPHTPSSSPFTLLVGATISFDAIATDPAGPYAGTATLTVNYA